MTRRIVSIASAATLLIGLSVGLAAPADATPAPGTCNVAISADATSATAVCNLSGTGYSTFRINGDFCSVSGCEWVGGTRVGSLQTSKVQAGGHITKVNETFYP